MKRCAAWLGVLFAIAGCSLPGRLAPVDPAGLVSRPFSSEILLTWDGAEYAGEFSRDADGSMQLSLTGEFLSIPLCFSGGKQGCTISQGELSVTFAAGDLPAGSLVASLERAFVLLGQAQVCEEEEGLVLRAGEVSLLCGEGLSYRRLSMEQGEILFLSSSFPQG